MDEGGVNGDGGHLGVGVDDEGDAFFLADILHELGAVLGEFVDVGEFELELEFASEGEHVHGERCDSVEVSAEDPPSVSCDCEVSFVESDLDDIGAAFEALEDVFDGVGEVCDCFSDGGHAFGVDAFEVFVGVGEGETGVLTDGVEEGELLSGEGVVDCGGVDVDGAEGLFSEGDGGADRGADLVLLDGVS